MLTGKLPCQADNPLEWAHCHRAPPAPAEAFALVPHGVSNLTLGLLGNRPEQRYQSAHGLLVDLDHCLAVRSRRARLALRARHA
jgi:hypothetical protein